MGARRGRQGKAAAATVSLAADAPAVLVVDDDEGMRESIRLILEEGGFRVATAADGRSALAELERQRPNLILSDIGMPDMDGYDLCRAVQQDGRFRFLPFIFLTGLDGRGPMQRSRELGADDYLTKPFEAEDLLTAVRGRLRRMTDLRQSTRQELDRFRQEILNSLTHEFRTPISILQSFVGLIQDGYCQNEGDLREFLNVIRVSGNRLARLVENFLALVALRSGQAEEDFRLGRAEVEMSSLVRQALKDFSRRPDAAARRLEAKIDSHALWAAVHPEMIRKAIAELLDNALKFNPPQAPPIEVRLRRARHKLFLEVADQGPGIPKEEQEKIFEEMYQFNRGKMEQQGAGLGLTIARGYARLNGGDLQVESAPGAGATFRILLPEITPKYQ